MPTLTAVFSAPFLGGSEIFNLEFLETVRDRGVSVAAVVPGQGPLTEAVASVAQRIDVVGVPTALQALSRFDARPHPVALLRGGAAVVGYLERLRRALRRTTGPVCCMGFRSQLAVAALRPRRPVGWLVHELVPPGAFGRLWALAARHPDTILAFSEAAARQPFLPSDRTRRLAVRLDLAPFLSLSPPTPPVRTIGLIGDLLPLKNHLGVLSVLRQLHARGVDCRALLVGRDTSALHFTHDHVAEVRRAVAATAGAARLVEARPDEIPGLLAQMDVVLQLSTAPESFGRVCVEAMAAGRPVVAFAQGALGEVVEDGRSGVLCPPGNLHAVASAVRSLVDDPSLYARMSADARTRARRCWGPGQRGVTVGDALADFAHASAKAAR